MKHTRYKTLDEFRAIIEPFEHDDYYPEKHRMPFVELTAASAIEVPYYNFAQFHKYAAILMECAKAKGVDEAYVREFIDHQHQTQLLQDETTNLIARRIWKIAGDKDAADRISVYPLICGAGKSTAISYMIQDVLTQGDHDGILIVTDRKDRMDEYLSPSPERDPALHDFLQGHLNQITILKEGADLPNSFMQAKKSPIVIMTTQRYFAMPKDDIKRLLRWGHDKHRRLILFDEAPIMTEHISIDRKLLNDIATAISERIPYQADAQAEKHFCLQHWETIRQHLYTAICEHEDLHDATEYITPFTFPQQELMDDDKRFLAFISKHRPSMRTSQEDYALKAMQIFRLYTEPCILYAGRSGSWYSNSISAVVSNRDKLTDLNAKVIILDGTGEIHPDYDPAVDDIRDARSFDRTMENLTIHNCLTQTDSLPMQPDCRSAQVCRKQSTIDGGDACFVIVGEG